LGIHAKIYDGDYDFPNYDVLDKKTLNYFDPKANSNKFYTIELHQSGDKFRVFTDYGRLGQTSKKEVRITSSKYSAESEFNRIFREKVKKGYVEIELAQSTTGSQKGQELIDATQIKIKQNVDSKKSQLDPILQQFVIQIFDEAGKKLNHFVKGNSNSNGASPLGKLSTKQISKGREILQDIAGNLSEYELCYDITKRNHLMGNMENLSVEFYRYIPKSFGRQVYQSSFLIADQDTLSSELDMLKFYEDSLRMGNIIFETSDIDKQYESLNSDIGILNPNDDKYISIVKYVKDSQSCHHGVDLTVKRIFTVNQKKAPKFDNSSGNVRELFHGSRSANLPGILSSNLKLPTQLKGVYITGAMFGPGIYFADQSTKSSQYSCSRFGGTANSYNTSFMFLADVALGKMKEEQNSTYYFKPPVGYDSVKGVAGRSLLHNEYITYKEDQQQLRYIIEFTTNGRF
jgi:poly [ADP-ribose] polymerase